MIYNRGHDFYCYRTNTSFSPIDTTKDIRKNKENVICKCKLNTWKSILDLYNDHDTTVVWDNKGIVPNPPEKKHHYRFNKNKDSYKVTTKQEKSTDKKDVKEKISKKNKTVTSREKKTTKHNNIAVQNLIERSKKSDYTKVCPEGICKANQEGGKDHHCKCKKKKEHHHKTTLCTDRTCSAYRIGNLTKSCIDFFCSLFKKQNLKVLKVAREAKKPVFAIRVDSSNLNILNPNEIKTKVKAFGTVGKNDKCMCPSRLEKAKKYGLGESCEGGVCKAARHGKYDKFNCHCAKTDLIECCDTTCDRIDSTRGKTKLIKTMKFMRDSGKNITSGISKKPLFEMVLDNNHMNILNTGEIYDVLRKADQSDMCPSGICRSTANKDRILNCKCLSKKIAPILHECNKKTCQPNEGSDKKSKFYICTRICSSLQNWTSKKNDNDLIYPENFLPNNPSTKNTMPLQLGKPKYNKQVVYAQKNIGQGDSNNRSKKKIVLQNVPEIYNPPTHKTLLEPRVIPKQVKKIREKRNVQLKRKPTQLFRSTKKIRFWNNNKSNAMTKKMRATEKLVMKEALKREKLINKKQKQMDREANRRKRELQKLHSREENHLNFLAGFLIGVVNLNLQIIIGVLSMVISIITAPIHSYIYLKHRIKDPVGTCKMFKHWIVNTWKARDTKISAIVENSTIIDVLSDHLENSALFEMFTNKGSTVEERQMYERKKKRRLKRIKKRHDHAMYSCRHTLLMTLRKHPCIWIYHICPFFYPQFIALKEFIKNFFHILLYIAALICWTPCVLCTEVVRAFWCCLLCSQ